LSPEIANRLERLKDDRVSGAVALALEALDLALAAPEARAELGAAFRRMHPAIVAVANVGRLLARSPAEAELLAVRVSLATGNQRIAAHAAAVLPSRARILTLSDSSTVEAVLRGVSPWRVWVLESLPGGEGHVLAARLTAEVLPDAAMGRIVPEIDYALAGIDAFDRAGAILHKVGTLPLALCCARFGKPFYAAGHSFKLAPTDTASLLEAAGEAGLRFDRTPPDLITAILTEQGRWQPADT
jgi:translation initiation factor 2B subunit (eIF-2B alpha/beta/delta family)